MKVFICKDEWFFNGMREESIEVFGDLSEAEKWLEFKKKDAMLDEELFDEFGRPLQGIVEDIITSSSKDAVIKGFRWFEKDNFFENSRSIIIHSYVVK